MKRTIPVLICSISGIILAAAYFSPYTEDWGDTVTIWFDVLASLAFVLGAGNLLRMHLKKVSNQGSGWGYSAIILIAFFATLTIGLFKIGVHPSVQSPHYAWSGDFSESGSPFGWLYEYVFKPLTSMMFAMLAFYVASAAFRAFRAKNVEAILLLGTAFIILLGRTYAGVFLTNGLPDSLSGLKFENLTVFIMNNFNLAGNRAITIGIALGIASVCLKILLGIDRSYLGSGDD